jgi:glycosyltransferase involved in cell wall biosynthesis
VPEELGGPVALILDSTEFAGAERYVVELVASLRGKCEFVVVLGDEAPEETGLRLRGAGARVETVPGLRRRPSFTSFRGLLRTLRALEPALVHVNLTDQGDSLGSLVAARLSRRPRLATLHLVLPSRSRRRERVSRAALDDTLVIGVSEAVATYLRGHEIRNVVVRNGIAPPKPVSDPRAALGLDGTGFVAGGIGRLEDQKGWDIFCRAASLVRKELDDSVFVVVGEGSERANLEQLPESRNVRFVGYRSNAASLMQAFDVLVVPSRYEGLGLTPLEAMYLGVPVIASDVPGLTEALGDAGITVPHEQPAALAEAILNVARDHGLRSRLVERGTRRVHELFSVERMATETLAVYRQVIASSAAPGRTFKLVPSRGHRSRREGVR